MSAGRPTAAELVNKLYYGENLDRLRAFPDEFVDLIYLDPPWNPKADYNVIFRDALGRTSNAQRDAFAGTWQWGPVAEDHYAYLTETARSHGAVPAPVGTLIAALRSAIGSNQMLAFVVEMTIRLVELHRVLRPTGSLYLHCDPTHSHYLRLILDTIFGPERFLGEIVWKRTTTHSDAKRWSPDADRLLVYSKSDLFTFYPAFGPHDPGYVQRDYRFREPDGRVYRLHDMASPNPRPNLMYEWKGHAPPVKGWRFSRETMERLDREGRIWYPDSKAKRPKVKRYLADMPGTRIGSVWTDLPNVHPWSKERLGWPTQKPLALLTRILEASTNPGDIVLDPFCGCGTALDAAESLGREDPAKVRQWIGIDNTWHAIAVMKARLRERFGLEVQVEGAPTEVEGARQIAQQEPNGRDQFEAWALSAVDAIPHGGPQKKGADRGADGLITFSGANHTLESAIVSVKSGHVEAANIQQLRGAMARHGGVMGLFITLEEPSKPMRTEAATAGLYHSEISDKDYPRVQILTVRELLEEGRKPQLPPLLSPVYSETLWTDEEVPALPQVRKKKSTRARRAALVQPQPSPVVPLAPPSPSAAEIREADRQRRIAEEAAAIDEKAQVEPVKKPKIPGQKTQRTPQGAQIPIPKRSEVVKSLKRVAKGTKLEPPRH